MKIVLAFDSFKGCLSAEEVCATAASALRNLYPQAEIIQLPLADGGEGTMQVLARYHRPCWQSCLVHDPLMRPIAAQYAISHDTKTAIMEMASAAGLNLLSEEERNTKLTTTFGVGEMMLDAVQRGCKHIVIGIGGSATTDGGVGMLAALGTKFYDVHGHPLQPIGQNLLHIDHVEWHNLLHDVTIEAICDVSNPLFGENGAAYVYGPQKGASTEDVCLLDKGLRHWANLAERPIVAGTGAAGGLGYGLTIIGAKLLPGVEVILSAARLEEHLVGANMVLTGEGRIDKQTLSGKLPFGVLQAAKKAGVPVCVMAGQVQDEQLLRQAGFQHIYSINPPGADLRDSLHPDVAKQHIQNTIKGLIP